MWSPTPELASRLGQAGADLLVGKELGAELVALKADALLDARFGRSRAHRASASAEGEPGRG